MSRLTKFAGSAFLIGIVWALLVFARTIFAEPTYHSRNFIPEDADLVISIDIHQLIERGFQDIVLLEQDNETFLSIVRYMQEKQESDIEVGIDYNSELIHFIVDHEDGSIQGTLLNLYDPEAFAKNVHQLIMPNDVFFTKENVGLILSNPGFRISPTSLKAIGENIMQNNSKEVKPFPWKTIHPAMTFSIQEPSPVTKLGAGVNLGIEVSDNEILLEGELTFPKDSTPPTMEFKGLRPNGFHLSSQFIPQLLNDSIVSFLEAPLPQINAISLNYRGTELVEDPGFAIVPDLDIILHFEDSISINTLLGVLIEKGQVERMTPTTFIYGNRMFYHTQISPSSLYLGRKQLENIKLITTDQLALVEGNLEAIASIEGKGMMRKLLELVSLYTSGRDFTETTESIEISLKLINDKTATLEGNIVFKDGHHAINEVIKLLLDGKFL